ncbi:MAG: regulatory protein RecX [Peptococcaceae bacterium]|jgi:regulatory protein|nr:recombination regulator RecX [Peptococcaceae bacterium]MDH7524116.1 regulatory protein RecX [Peptococcaceae bacterium]
MKEEPFAFALKRLARRGYSSEEIKQALLRAGYGLPETDETVQRLQRAGYLDDENLAREIYSYHTTRKPRGPLYLKQLLEIKGIPRDIIDDVLADYDSDKEIETACRLANKYLLQKKYSPGTLAGNLARKGFSDETIRKVVELCFRGHCLNGD